MNLSSPTGEYPKRFAGDLHSQKRRPARKTVSGGVGRNNHEPFLDLTVDNIRKRTGIPPAPGRSRNTTWRQFPKAHWEGLAPTDFFTSEVWCGKRLITFYTLFVIELRSRLAQWCGTTLSPNDQWMTQWS